MTTLLEKAVIEHRNAGKTYKEIAVLENLPVKWVKEIVKSYPKPIDKPFTEEKVIHPFVTNGWNWDVEYRRDGF
jgi:hypothetical protein